MSAPQTQFEIAGRSLRLQRYPLYANENLQAWDAADQYLLEHLSQQEHTTEQLLILNDQFGALALAMRPKATQWVSDSLLAHRALEQNLKNNHLDDANLERCSSLDLSGQSAPAFGSEPALKSVSKSFSPDLVLIKIPKSLGLLEDQLIRLRPHLRANTKILAAAMTRHVHNSTLNLFEQIIGPTRTSLARKKARLIFCDPGEMAPLRAMPTATEFEVNSSTAQATPLRLKTFAGTFSAARLDRGTELLLNNLQIPLATSNITDLGCGCGVLGIAAAMRCPDACITFADESYRATASTRAGLQTNFGMDDLSAPSRFQVLTTHNLDGVEDHSQDLVLINPPFHDRAARSYSLATSMFQDAKRCLRSGGRVWVVGNRQLDYLQRLNSIFGNCQQSAANPKFRVFSSIKR